MMAQLRALCGSEQEVAALVDAHAIHTVERQTYLPGIGPGGDHKIVLQLAVVGVKQQVDAVVDLRCLHARIVWNVGTPCCWIVAEEVVAVASGRLHSSKCLPGRTAL